MKRIIYELRLGLFFWVLRLATSLVPKEATKTLTWLTQIPFE